MPRTCHFVGLGETSEDQTTCCAFCGCVLTGTRRYKANRELLLFVQKYCIETRFVYSALVSFLSIYRQGVLALCDYCSQWKKRYQRAEVKRMIPLDKFLMFITCPGQYSLPDWRYVEKFYRTFCRNKGCIPNMYHGMLLGLMGDTALDEAKDAKQMVKVISMTWIKHNGNTPIFYSKKMAKHMRKILVSGSDNLTSSRSESC